jgi:CDP-diacylglycerol--glycerol-3-phosphate 3-phosphatidyltransferase
MLLLILNPINALKGLIMKFVVNGITFSRIILALLLFQFEPLSTSFFILYMLCGLSDMADGYLARKTGTTSEFGAKLDSLADLVMVFAVLIILIPVLTIPLRDIIWIACIALIRFISLLIVAIKFRKFGIVHTYANKATGFALFLFPLLLAVIGLPITTLLLCTMGTISALEELLMHLINTDLDINQKSIFK